MRYRLRTLLIALAILPPLLAGGWIWGWREFAEWKQHQEQERQAAEVQQILEQILAAEQARRVGPPRLTPERVALVKQLLEESNPPTPGSETSD
jgi:hypothetical protein